MSICILDGASVGRTGSEREGKGMGEEERLEKMKGGMIQDVHVYVGK